MSEQYDGAIFGKGQELRNGFVNVYPPLFSAGAYVFGLVWGERSVADRALGGRQMALYRIRVKLKPRLVTP